MKVYHNTWLYFYLYGANGVEWLDIGLPQPNYLLHANTGIFIGWLIKGYPGTPKSREYFNDIIARFVATFAEYRPERLPYRPELKRRAHVDLKTVHDLKELQELKSLYWGKEKAEKVATAKSGEIDKIFWAIKLYTEAHIRQQGEGVPVVYDELERWAFQMFWLDEKRAKDKSTLRAKCRSVWQWYNNRNWTIPKRKGEWEMTRSERAKANAKLKAIKAEAKVKAAVESLKFLGEKISVRNVAKQAGVADRTAMKYLKQLKEEGKI